jgi:hypothetical protein
MLVVYAMLTMVHMIELSEYGTENLPRGLIIYPLTIILILTLA